MGLCKEEPFQLPTQDNSVIYGVLSRSVLPTKKAVFLVHGFGCHKNDFLMNSAAHFFADNGYDVIRFDLYGAARDARNGTNTTLQTYVLDLELVLDRYRGDYDEIFCAGHSYGGQTLLSANPKASAIAFWDSSYRPYKSFWSFAERFQNTDYFCVDTNGMTCLVHNDLIEEGKILDQKAEDYASKIKAPCLIVKASNVIFKEPVPLHEALSCPKKLSIIVGADHFFTTNNTIQTLFKETLAWFNLHSKKIV